MKPTIIGHNWFFPSLSLWLSYNWLWTPSNGELIDSGLNSSLFNNYAAIGRAEQNQWPPPTTTFFVCLLWEESFLLSSPIWPQRFIARCWAGRLQLDEKCPPARYMKVWNCRLLFALGRVPQKVFLLLLTERAECLAAAAAANPPATSSSSPDCFCFQVTSYLLLQLFQFLRACCMKTEGFCGSRSLGNVHKALLKDNPKKKEERNHRMLLPFMLSGHRRSCHRPPEATSSNE